MHEFNAFDSALHSKAECRSRLIFEEAEPDEMIDRSRSMSYCLYAGDPGRQLNGSEIFRKYKSILRVINVNRNNLDEAFTSHV